MRKIVGTLLWVSVFCFVVPLSLNAGERWDGEEVDFATLISQAKQGKVFVMPGYVYVFDRYEMRINIDKGSFLVDPDVVVTSRGHARTLEHVSAGDFVIATIQGTVVRGISIIPPGKGF